MDQNSFDEGLINHPLMVLLILCPSYSGGAVLDDETMPDSGPLAKARLRGKIRSSDESLPSLALLILCCDANGAGFSSGK